jgi:DHA2 family multidrug resistance protein
MWSFFCFFNLFGSFVCPIYLQTYGYTATLAGLVLGPVGFPDLRPFNGEVVRKVNPKWLLALGISTAALSTYMMSIFNLSADFSTVCGRGCTLGRMGLFLSPFEFNASPLSAGEKMGNATALFNLIRNLGGSFGIVCDHNRARGLCYTDKPCESLTP